MKFNELNKTIPYKIGPLHSHSIDIYPGVSVTLPGRHQFDTTPAGGDVRVLVTDSWLQWERHPFSHVDIFNIVERLDDALAEQLLFRYLDVVLGDDPLDLPVETKIDQPDPNVILCALQVLAVAEHRRYARYEPVFGGRFLPFRFAAGIQERRWTAKQAGSHQRRGRPGVEQLERVNGLPRLTRLLME